MWDSVSVGGLSSKSGARQYVVHLIMTEHMIRLKLGIRRSKPLVVSRKMQTESLGKESDLVGSRGGERSMNSADRESPNLRGHEMGMNLLRSISFRGPFSDVINCITM